MRQQHKSIQIIWSETSLTPPHPFQQTLSSHIEELSSVPGKCGEVRTMQGLSSQKVAANGLPFFSHCSFASSSADADKSTQMTHHDKFLRLAFLKS